MKKYLAFILASLIIAGCTKNEEPVPEVTFTLNISGFNITADDFGSLKSTQADFSLFTHVFSGGVISFEDENGAVYSFDTGSTNPDGYSFTLSAGTYTITGQSIEPSPQGRPTMSYNIPGQEIVISESTTSIDINVTPTCGLVLVGDEFSLVSNAYMNRPNVQGTWIFGTQDIFRYSYFLPESPYHAFIVKNDATVLDISTITLQIGYVYKIDVTESGGSSSLDLIPTFQDGGTVIW